MPIPTPSAVMPMPALSLCSVLALKQLASVAPAMFASVTLLLHSEPHLVPIPFVMPIPRPLFSVLALKQLASVAPAPLASVKLALHS